MQFSGVRGYFHIEENCIGAVSPRRLVERPANVSEGSVDFRPRGRGLLFCPEDGGNRFLRNVGRPGCLYAVRRHIP